MRIQINTSLIRKTYLDAIRRAWSRRNLVLFTGAGVASAYGIPNWNALVLDLLINETGQFDRFLTPYRTALASWLTETFGLTPTSLARVVRYRFDYHRRNKEDKRTFPEILRAALYRTYQPAPSGRITLTALADLIESSEAEGRRIPAIVTTNYDDLIELELRSRGLDVSSVYNSTRGLGSSLPVVHVHGFLPREGRIPRNELVFTEDEYHRLTYSTFNWAVSTLANYLRQYRVLFIGFSMSDPNLRRILDATCPRGKSSVHFVLRKDYFLSQELKHRAIMEVEDRAERARHETGSVERKDLESVSQAIDKMLDRAHRFDRELFKDMGVGTIWVNEYDDILAVLDLIRITNAGREARAVP